MQSRLDNPETLATLGTQDKVRKQTKEEEKNTTEKSENITKVKKTQWSTKHCSETRSPLKRLLKSGAPGGLSVHVLLITSKK